MPGLKNLLRLSLSAIVVVQLAATAFVVATGADAQIAVRRSPIVTAQARFGVGGETQAPEDIAQWDMICFCETTVGTPHSVIRMDTNGRILFKALGGATLATLRAAVPNLSESQLRTLEDWSLVHKSGGTYWTSFPALGPDKSRSLRAALNQEARALLPRISKDAATISQILAKEELETHAYAVIFSYVLDGLVWDELKAKGIGVPWAVTADHPFWNGLFWAVFPKRSEAPGTDTFANGPVTVRVLWTAKTLPALNRMMNSPEFTAWLKMNSSLPIRSKMTNFRYQGEYIRFPVIANDSSDPIFKAGSRMAEKIAERIVVRDWSGFAPGTDRRQAAVIAAHEFIWECLTALRHAGVVTAPPQKSQDDLKSLAPFVIATVAR